MIIWDDTCDNEQIKSWIWACFAASIICSIEGNDSDRYWQPKMIFSLIVVSNKTGSWLTKANWDRHQSTFNARILQSSINYKKNIIK